MRLKSPLMIIAIFGFLTAAGGCGIALAQTIGITMNAPHEPLKMGDTPTFVGHITNTGDHSLKNLVVYASLVSLEPGHEHPVDLEDWADQRAIHIDRLEPGASMSHNWSLRLIEAGRYGLALTVIDPAENSPAIGPLTTFQVASKPTVIAGRILPVAVGEPLLLLALLGYIRTRRNGYRFSRNPR